MDEKIGPETEERIRELCRKISVAHNLDEEIQRELYSHMEDKLLGYLSGQEKLTEEDAFVLVREHFGDPEEVKEMLADVHDTEVKMAFLRKVGLVASLTFFLTTAGEYLLRILSAVVLGWVDSLPINQDTSPFSATPIPHLTSFLPLPLQWCLTLIAHELPAVCAVAILWFILSTLKRNRTRGVYSWYEKASQSLFLIFVLSGFLLAYIIILGIEHLPFYQSIPKLGTFYSSEAVFNIIYIILNGLQCLVWLWWFDDRSGRYGPIFGGIVFWIVYNILIYNPIVIITLDLRNDFSSAGLTNFFHHVFSVKSFTSELTWYSIYSLVAMLVYILYKAVNRSSSEEKSAPAISSV